MKTRKSGILLGISSLPGQYGIGDFGEEAYAYVDFLASAKQSYWQILPLSITGYGDSPYQSFSAFAGNPYFIDLKELIESGFLTKKEVEAASLNTDDEFIDYGKLYEKKYPLLRKAYNRSVAKLKNELESFFLDNIKWLREFSLFMTIKESFNSIGLADWPDEYRNFYSDSVLEFEKNNKHEIYFWVFTQYFFLKQWKKLKQYANSKGIKIMGDLPIYISDDSSDLWAHPELFKLDEKLRPLTIAGVPPDIFTETGQLWGNPIYDWEEMQRQGYKYWIERVAFSLELYDTVRIDHFRGFDAYWEVPFGSENAINGEWVKGPSVKLFKAIKDSLGDVDIVAEDLGFQSEGLKELMNATNFPGMKILQFAFDPYGDSEFLPHNYYNNCIVYTGTHDNKTIKDWINTANESELDYAKEYLRLNETEGYDWGFIRGAWASCAYLAIVQQQDLLGLGEEARMNEPSTIGKNWRWRVKKEALGKELADKLGRLTQIYRRG